MGGASRYADDRNTSLGLPTPTQIVRNAHGSCWVPGHGMDPAIASASSGTQDDQRLGCQAVEPVTRGHGLIGVGIVAEPAPIAFLFNRFVGNRSLNDQDEWVEL